MTTLEWAVCLGTIPIVAAIFWNLWWLKPSRKREVLAWVASGGHSPYLCRDTIDWVDDFERAMWRRRGEAATYVWLILAPLALLMIEVGR